MTGPWTGSKAYECIGGPHDGRPLALSPGVTRVAVLMPRAMKPHDLAYHHTNAALPNLRIGHYELREHSRLGHALYWTG